MGAFLASNFLDPIVGVLASLLNPKKWSGSKSERSASKPFKLSICCKSILRWTSCWYSAGIFCFARVRILIWYETGNYTSNTSLRSRSSNDSCDNLWKPLFPIIQGKKWKPLCAKTKIKTLHWWEDWMISVILIYSNTKTWKVLWSRETGTSYCVLEYLFHQLRIIWFRINHV